MGFSENFAICTVFQIKDERRALYVDKFTEM